MKKIAVLIIFILLSGCFIVFTHESRDPSIITVHLLPPKVSEGLKPSKAINAYIGVVPFEFDLKFSEDKQPYYFDYSYLPKEFYQNVLVLLENGIFNKVIEQDVNENIKNPEQLIKKITENKLDTGLFIKI